MIKADELTPLEALENLWYGQKTTENYKLLEKSLKALAIIKEKLGIELSYCEETKQYLIIIGGLFTYPLKNKEQCVQNYLLV